MLFSYNWLQSFFSKKLPPPDKLAVLLTMHSFETHTKSDFVLDIDVLPNRVSDCSGHLGIAREISLITNYQLLITGPQLKKSEFKTEDFVKLEVREKDLCPRYMALLVRGVKVGPSPKWMRDRLVAVGQKPINNIVDAANYVMLETGQPLHAFDLNNIEKRKIIVRKSKKGEKITTLDDKTYELNENILVIADAKDALAIAGIKGGKKAEITNKTKDIIIEAAVFNASNIRQTSRSINFKTDASFRFEHGISLFLPEKALETTARLVQEIACGEIAKTSADICSVKPKLATVNFKKEDVDRLIGQKISSAEINKILKSLGFSVGQKGGNYFVQPPSERLDINIKEDMIEEIARIYGYENIPTQAPREILAPIERNEEYFYSDIIRNILTGLGFCEVYNYSFCQKGDVELANPIAKDRRYLRINLTDGLKENIEKNLKYFDSVKLFEIGKVFYKGSGGEKVKIAAAIDYKKGQKKDEIFFESKGIVETLLNKLGIAGVWFTPVKKEGNIANVMVGQDDIGFLDQNVFELDLACVIELATEDIAYKPISKFPAVIRDISLFVPANTRVIEVMDIIENTAGQLLIDTDLFDMYIPPEQDRKSLAFRLIFQSHEKTLTDKEVNKLLSNSISALEENIEWQVRN
jgi:phenylalanyl-tRNA synthetase beta chain